MTKKQKTPKIEFSVGTADEYEFYIADIQFSKICGLIISQERGPGEFDISVHSFVAGSDDDYDYCRNKRDQKIKLSNFEETIKHAKRRLLELNKPFETDK